ncbi:MAG: hypothetical protein CMJ89_12195 [Planctomycetes bacterium]|jgi:serine/threonine protein kinase/formylglycine-generating enzyme required for sulfatase activity|nr:hypothetical protein [Planctomycetota bacterium]
MGSSGSVSRLFGEFIERNVRSDAPDFDDFCRDHPQHEEDLRKLKRDWDALANAAQRDSTSRTPAVSSQETGTRSISSQTALLIDMLKGHVSPPSGSDHSGSTLADSPDLKQHLDAFASHWSLGEIVPGTGDVEADGREFGEFGLLRRIGSGGMGEVWLAHQPALKRKVAIKFLNLRKEASEGAAARFMDEARLAARLQHPNIVPVYTAGAEEGRLYYVMEYVDGVTLDEVIEALEAYFNSNDLTLAERLPEGIIEQLGFQEVLGQSDAQPSGSSISSSSSTKAGRVSRHDLQRKAVRFFVQSLTAVSLAVDYAHRNGVIHGDIKPSNLMFDRFARLRVLDFGLAHLLEDAPQDSSSRIAGTPRYMSPELVAGLPAGLKPGIDVYALGATLYECVTLRPIYQGASRAEILQKITTENPTRPREINPKLHPHLELILLRSVSRNPKRRYPSAGELAADLRGFVNHQPMHGGGRVWFSLKLRTLLMSRFGAIAVGALCTALLAFLAIGVWAGLSWWRASGTQRHVDRKTVEVEMILADIDSRFKRDNGQEESSLVSSVEAELKTAREILLGLRGNVPAVEFDVAYEHYRRNANSARILANAIAGNTQSAWQLLESSRRRGSLEEDVESRLAALGLLSELVVGTRKKGNVQVAVRAINKATKEIEEEILHEGLAPLVSGALLEGVYHVTLVDEDGADIRFPVQLYSGERLKVTVPYLPSEIPEGMVYVAGYQEEGFIVGDIATEYGESRGEELRYLSEPYFVDRYEVTNGDFYEFYNHPDYLKTLKKILKEDGEDLTEELEARLLRGWPWSWELGRPRVGTEDKPVIWGQSPRSLLRINRSRRDTGTGRQWGREGRGTVQARAFARWKEKELMNEFQWEKTARGIDGRVYCYGDRFDLRKHSSEVLLDVGSMSSDVSVYGVYDLMGSVPELVLSPYGQGFRYRGGGFWNLNAKDMRLARRSSGARTRGFRCAVLGCEELEVVREKL